MKGQRYRLAGVSDGSRVELLLDERPVVLGSGAGCDLQLPIPSISRRHAELRPLSTGVEVIDLGSKNGTFVEGAEVSRTLLRVGQTVRFARTELTLEKVPMSDLAAAIVFRSTPEQRQASKSREESTSDLKSINAQFCEDVLVPALSLLRSNAPPTRVAQTVGRGILQNSLASSLEISSQTTSSLGILFQGKLPAAGKQHVHLLTTSAGPFQLRAELPTSRAIESLRPLAELAVSLISLAAPPEAAGSEQAPMRLPPQQPEPVTVTPQVTAIYRDAAQIARTDVGILISGESGVGKEVLARYIYRASPRAQQPFVAVNCAALPRDLLEAELFGIEKGVATGVERRPGKFEQADGGTLFLDEIADMARETQAMILRVLQEGEVFRIGASQPRKVSVRIIAATNHDLDELITSGGFRNDLFYRIATWRTFLPPLRRRRGDIANLAAHFLSEEAQRLGVSVNGISKAALELLEAYDWPGNIRQLRNEMARAVAFIPDGGLLETSRLSTEIISGPRQPADADTLDERLKAFEKKQLALALHEHQYDTAATAEALGLPRSTLYRRMKKLGVTVATE